MVYHGGLELVRVSASAASSGDRDAPFVMVPKYLQSQKDEISLATVSVTEGKGDGTVGSMMGVRRKECVMLTVSLGLQGRRVRVEYVRQAEAMNDYKVKF